MELVPAICPAAAAAITALCRGSTGPILWCLRQSASAVTTYGLRLRRCLMGAVAWACMAATARAAPARPAMVWWYDCSVLWQLSVYLRLLLPDCRPLVCCSAFHASGWTLECRCKTLIKLAPALPFVTRSHTPMDDQPPALPPTQLPKDTMGSIPRASTQTCYNHFCCKDNTCIDFQVR